MKNIWDEPVIDSVIENEMTEQFENMTETEKEHVIMQCNDAASKEEADSLLREMKSDIKGDIVAAMANTDIGNTVDNSGVR